MNLHIEICANIVGHLLLCTHRNFAYCTQYTLNWTKRTFSWQFGLQQELSDLQKSLKSTKQMRDMGFAVLDKIQTELSKVMHDAFIMHFVTSYPPFSECDACETPVWSQYLWLWCLRWCRVNVYSKFPWKYFWGPRALVSWKGLILKLSLPS